MSTEGGRELVGGGKEGGGERELVGVGKDEG